LAAGLTCQSGVPNADQVVEDIFAGGDGWCGAQPIDNFDSSSTNGRRIAGSSVVGLTSSDDGGHWSDDVPGTMRANKRSWPDFQFSKRVRGSGDNITSLRSRPSFGQGSNSDLDKEYGGSAPEVDELDAREDFRCWNYKE
jgi:hypothetical protein